MQQNCSKEQRLRNELFRAVVKKQEPSRFVQFPSFDKQHEQNCTNSPVEESCSFDTVMSDSCCVEGEEEEAASGEEENFEENFEAKCWREVVRLPSYSSSLSSLFSSSSSIGSDEGSDSSESAVIPTSTPFSEKKPIEGRFLIDGAWRMHDLRLRGKDTLQASFPFLKRG